ncbi:polysaccharide deacetylase family protein [Paenibacillus sp. YPG26]|uniref:polysaccharide deacetylase family protein n=1 Tax=Paenibacillus sp. YPG26 TaxID=2878915 RepID=UPI00203FF40B|nr:polysaccharide deacetylase family protein [Paenibacillus sp. YPG26]USB31875.1 polysaccharide deacetylase family protein [Paenibacillus sp. YPG26]
MSLKRYHYILIIGSLIIILSIINHIAVLHREAVSKEQMTSMAKNAAQNKVIPVNEVKYSFREIYEVKTNEKKVALTFDDGPDNKYTPQILDILQENQVKATFFLVGRQIDKDPSVVRRIHNEGHEIGNHTVNHPNLNNMEIQEITQEIEENNTKIKDLTGYTPVLFRSPYGNASAEVREVLKHNQLLLINWSVDTRDWKETSPKMILANLKKEVRPGSIILQHSFGGRKVHNTIQALPEEIKWLKEQGYSLVTVSELIKQETH